MKRLYYPLSDYLKERFKGKVYKVTLNAGLTCPNRDGTKGRGGCMYCDSSTLVPQDYEKGTDIKSQLQRGMEKIRRRHRAEKFIAYFQINTNTFAPAETLRGLYRDALSPEVVAIAVSTRPDCVDDDVLGLLSEIKKERHLWLELGLQTANDSTLEAINRGHTAFEFADAVKRASERGMDVCAHIIIGLPGEGRDDYLSTTRLLSDLKVWGVKFHQLQVLKGTPLEGLYNQGRVKTLTLDEYASAVVECLEELPPETVIHRLSGDTPERYLVAPRWGANKFMVREKITGLLKARSSCQGAWFANV